jgi:hypothetical protein
LKPPERKSPMNYDSSHFQAFNDKRSKKGAMLAFDAALKAERLQPELC